MKITIILPNGKKVESKQEKSIIIVGRSKDCDLQIDDEALSRKHCRIEECDGNFFVTDLGSTNGVFLNGDRIQSETKLLYDTFLQLHIGPFECFLESTEILTVKVGKEPTLSTPITPRQRTKKESTSDHTKVITPNLARKKETETKSKLGVYFSLIAFLAVVGYLLMEVFNKQPETITAPEEISAPSEVRDITVL
jgi:pSer/pThr/pTyr-binding forkhead associated (FHA) protein